MSMTILSLGAGVQSTALLMLSADGTLPKLDACIFSDTQWEPKAVYDHLDRLEREVAQPAGIPIYRVSSGHIRNDPLDPTKRYAPMPLYVKNADGSPGMGRRTCTTEYKVVPIKRQVRLLLGATLKENGNPGPVPKGHVAEQWIGISTDEFHRAKDSDVKYVRHRFPLLDLGWSRKDCERYLRRNGFGDTPKSACIGCPFHGNRAWRELRDNSPEEWADAVEFDRLVREGGARAKANGSLLAGEAYLHRSRVPLDQAPIDRVTSYENKQAQIDIFDAIADAEEELSGCSPYGCRADEDDLGVVWVDIDGVAS